MNILRLMGFLPPNGFDPDASAFFSAAGITNATQKSAVNQLVKDLKGANLWSKMLVVYPLVGGTYDTCKYNLKDPRDLDAAYRLKQLAAYSGGTYNYSLTGVSYTYLQGYLDYRLNTYLPFNATSETSTSMGIYVQTSIPVNNGTTFGDDGQNFIGKRLGGSILHLAIGGSYGSAATASVNPHPPGFISGGTNGSRLTSLFVNGVKQADGTGSSSLTSTTYKLLGQYPNLVHSFAYVGTGMSTTEHQTLYTIVQKFQTTLGRQV